MSATTPSPNQSELYREAFVAKCLTLVGLGRANLAADLSAAEEPHITGELVRAIREILESDTAEEWMLHFHIADDPPQNTGGRLGKSRPRIDIEMEVSGARGKRPVFHIEAKRLYRSDSVKEYLGPRGLEMFVFGQYAPLDTSAGMLGYVQNNSPAIWLQRLAAGIQRHRVTLALDAQFDAKAWVSEEPRLTRHQRSANKPIRVYHQLLDLA